MASSIYSKCYRLFIAKTLYFCLDPYVTAKLKKYWMDWVKFSYNINKKLIEQHIFNVIISLIFDPNLKM